MQDVRNFGSPLEVGSRVLDALQRGREAPEVFPW